MNSATVEGCKISSISANYNKISGVSGKSSQVRAHPITEELQGFF